MFTAVKSAAKKEMFGPAVERINALELVIGPDGKKIGKNMVVDMQTGAVWLLAGHLNNVGERDTLPPKGQYSGKVVDHLSVVENGITFTVDAEGTSNEKLWGTYSIWRSAGEFLISLNRIVGTVASSVPTTATMTTVPKR